MVEKRGLVNSDGYEHDDIMIVKVTGKTSKTIIIPDTVCEFFNIGFGDILKLKVEDKKKGKKK